jgi:hypothetical protein
MAWRDVNATSLLVAAGIRLPWEDHMDETMTVANAQPESAPIRELFA